MALQDYFLTNSSIQMIATSAILIRVSRALLFVAAVPSLHAQTPPPELSAWLRNTTGATGYGGIAANVQQVRYSADNVYVNCSDIPGYSIGPWQGDPNIPSNQNFLFQIPRHPTAVSGTPTATPLGPIAVLKNGVVL